MAACPFRVLAGPLEGVPRRSGRRCRGSTSIAPLDRSRAVGASLPEASNDALTRRVVPDTKCRLGRSVTSEPTKRASQHARLLADRGGTSSTRLDSARRLGIDDNPLLNKRPSRALTNDSVTHTADADHPAMRSFRLSDAPCDIGTYAWVCGRQAGVMRPGWGPKAMVGTAPPPARSG